MEFFYGIIFLALTIFLYDKFFSKKEITSVEKFKNEVQKYKKFISKKDYLTTRSEGEFLWRLLEYTKDKDVLICPKVRVGDIIEIKNFSNGNRKFSISSRFDRSHVDFVVIQKSTLKIICAIELDDSTHSAKIAKERDEIKNFLFSFVGIPLIRFNNSNPSDSEFQEKGL